MKDNITKLVRTYTNALLNYLEPFFREDVTDEELGETVSQLQHEQASLINGLEHLFRKFLPTTKQRIKEALTGEGTPFALNHEEELPTNFPEARNTDEEEAMRIEAARYQAEAAASVETATVEAMLASTGGASNVLEIDDERSTEGHDLGMSLAEEKRLASGQGVKKVGPKVAIGPDGTKSVLSDPSFIGGQTEVIEEPVVDEGEPAIILALNLAKSRISPLTTHPDKVVVDNCLVALANVNIALDIAQELVSENKITEPVDEDESPEEDTPNGKN